jgi:hypothetical protein
MLPLCASKSHRSYIMGTKAYNRSNIRKLLICSQGNGLDKKLVATLGFKRWFLLHCLQYNYHGVYQLVQESENSYSNLLAPVTSTSFPGSIRPEFGLTQYLDHVNSSRCLEAQIGKGTNCLGAVVLTCYIECQQSLSTA